MNSFEEIFDKVFDDVVWDDVNKRTQKDLLILFKLYQYQKNETEKFFKQKEALVNELVKMCNAIEKKLNKEEKIKYDYFERWLQENGY